MQNGTRVSGVDLGNIQRRKLRVGLVFEERLNRNDSGNTGKSRNRFIYCCEIAQFKMDRFEGHAPPIVWSFPSIARLA